MTHGHPLFHPPMAKHRPMAIHFFAQQKEKMEAKEKKRVQAIIGHLEFKNNSCRQTVVANNFFQYFMAPPL